MGSVLRIEAIGIPAPQGSKTRFPGKAVIGRDGKPTIVGGGMRESSKKVKPWRESVAAFAMVAARRERWVAPPGPIRLVVVFHMPRIKEHFGTGRNAARLKDDAPKWHIKYPDLSKLVRSTEDALVTARVLVDDSMIAVIEASKVYCDPGQQPGATITIEPMDSREALAR